MVSGVLCFFFLKSKRRNKNRLEGYWDLHTSSLSRVCFSRLLCSFDVIGDRTEL